VDIDVCGPMQNKSLGGASYFVIFIDNRTRFTWIYFLRKKSDVFEYFQRVLNTIKCNNQSSMNLVNNPIYHARSKHIET
jgi:hypothetical protein